MNSEFVEIHQVMIAIAAYCRAGHREFHEGDPVADWLEADAELEQMPQVEPAKQPGMSAKQVIQKTES